MSDAQKEILKMLSDNVITVEEAERLMKALNEGENRKQDTKARPGGRGFSGIFEAVGEALNDIGPMVKNTVDDVITGLRGDDMGGQHGERLEDVEPVQGKYVIPQGTRMTIVNNWKGGAGKGDLFIQGVSGDACGIEGDSSKYVKVRQNSARFVIHWSGEPLKVEVPQTVTSVDVKAKGENIHARQLACEIDAKTFGGELELLELTKDFRAKTMGGNINLLLSKGWQGRGWADTVGGSIEILIPGDASLKADATTMGGTIKVDNHFRQFEGRPGFPGQNNVQVRVGEGFSDSQIGLKTMGGDITLEKVQHEGE